MLGVNFDHLANFLNIEGAEKQEREGLAACWTPQDAAGYTATVLCLKKIQVNGYEIIISFNDSHCRQQIYLLKWNYKLPINLRRYRAEHSF